MLLILAAVLLIIAIAGGVIVHPLLFLIAIDADALGDRLRWEPSRNDELFPHLYGELDLAAVTDVIDMPLRSDGTHAIPELKP